MHVRVVSAAPISTQRGLIANSIASRLKTCAFASASLAVETAACLGPNSRGRYLKNREAWKCDSSRGDQFFTEDTRMSHFRSSLLNCRATDRFSESGTPSSSATPLIGERPTRT